MERKPFSGKIELTYVGNALYRLDKEFVYTPPESTGYKPVVVPEGFRTDLASIPAFARWLISVSGDTNLAALPHDYLYHTQLRSRAEADHIMLLAMEDADKMDEYNIPLWKRRIIYRALRIGGWLPWSVRAKEINKIRKQLENDGVENTEKDS